MIRHFEHDIVHQNVYTDLESFVKAAKYAERSFDFLKEDSGEGAIKNKRLYKFTQEMTENKKNPKKQVELITKYFENIGKPLPFEVQLEVGAKGKSAVTLKANEKLITEFWDTCRQTMWDGANKKIKQINADFKKKIRNLTENDVEGAKAIYEEMKKYHQMLVVEDHILHDNKAGIPDLLDSNYLKNIENFRTNIKKFKQKIAKNGLLKYVDPQESLV